MKYHRKNAKEVRLHFGQTKQKRKKIKRQEKVRKREKRDSADGDRADGGIETQKSTETK